MEPNLENINTGKHEAFRNVDIDNIMNEVDEAFKKGEITRTPVGPDESADIADSAADRLEARGKQH